MVWQSWMMWLRDGLGTSSATSAGGTHSAGRDSRGCPARAGSLARTTRPSRAPSNAEERRSGCRLNLLDEKLPERPVAVAQGLAHCLPANWARLRTAWSEGPRHRSAPAQASRCYVFYSGLGFLSCCFASPAYGVVWLDVRADDAAYFTRRFLQHPRFATQAQRMGVVARTHHKGVDFWQWHHTALQRAR